MARNKFDVDETLETPFNIKHLLRAGVYIGRHKKKMILSLLFSAISAACSLLGPMLIQRAIDVSVPNKDYTELVVLAIIMLVSIVASVLFARARSKYMIVVGQEIFYDTARTCSSTCKSCPSNSTTTVPHGKILTRVYNYVNSVSDALSNGIINFVLEIFNLILIAVFMFLCDVRLSLIVMAGIPLFLVIVLLIKPAQRRAWQECVQQELQHQRLPPREPGRHENHPGLHPGGGEPRHLRKAEQEVLQHLDESPVHLQPGVVFRG